MNNQSFSDFPKWLSAHRLEPEQKFADSPWNTLGVDECRNPWFKDFGAVTHCSAFRRLAHKTQVHLNPQIDFPRSRLTHSMEVSHISRQIVRAFCSIIKHPEPSFAQAFEDATATVCLAHDLGQPPFGHMADEFLNGKLREAGVGDGFEGNKQNLRVVCKTGVRPGLNLTAAVLDGLLKYKAQDIEIFKKKQGSFYSSERKIYLEVTDKTGTGTFRNPICAIMEASDDISYLSGDLEDACKFNVIGENEVGQIFHGLVGFDDAWREIKSKDGWIDLYRSCKPLGNFDPLKSAIIKPLIIHVLSELKAIWRFCDGDLNLLPKILHEKLKPSEKDNKMNICYSNLESDKETGRIAKKIKDTLYSDYILKDKWLNETEFAAEKVLERLWSGLIPLAEQHDGPKAKKLKLMLPGYIQEKFKFFDDTGVHTPEERFRINADYISGMTDRYAIKMAARLSGEAAFSHGWR